MKRVFISLATMLLFSSLQAQTYFFQTVQEPYVNLQSSTAVSTGIVWDDENFFPIAIPFPFTANGNTIDSIYVGNIGVSSVNFMTYTEGDPIMAIYYTDADQVDMGALNTGAPESPISYKTGIEDGKGFLTVEYKNAAFYEDSLTSNFDYVNVQITFVDDNSVQIHYGPSQVSFPEMYFENDMGNTIGFIPDYDIVDTTTTLNSDAFLLTGNPLSPSLISFPPTPGTTDEPGLNSVPTDGTKYVFATDSIPLSISDFELLNIQIENPINNVLNITKGKDRVKAIEFWNLNGQMIYLSKNTNTDVSMLSKGLYLIKILDKDGQYYTQKVIKN